MDRWQLGSRMQVVHFEIENLKDEYTEQEELHAIGKR